MDRRPGDHSSVGHRPDPTGGWVHSCSAGAPAATGCSGVPGRGLLGGAVPRATRLGATVGRIGFGHRRSECRRPGGSGPAVAAQLPGEWSAEKRRRAGPSTLTGRWAGGEWWRAGQRAGTQCGLRDLRCRAPVCLPSAHGMELPVLRGHQDGCRATARRSCRRVRREPTGSRRGRAAGPARRVLDDRARRRPGATATGADPQCHRRYGVTATILVTSFLAVAYGLLRNLA